jgi:hypothetical protein
VVSFTPRALYPQRKSPWYPLDGRLGGSQSRSGRGGEEKNSQPTPRIEPENPDHPARSPALYRLSCHGSYSVHVHVLFILVTGTRLAEEPSEIWHIIIVSNLGDGNIGGWGGGGKVAIQHGCHLSPHPTPF